MRLGDLVQLERLAQQFATRDQFLAELALDPPAATGDLSGTPYLDEDYLILSTVHSAKGQEWDAVFILNVADGNFPSEFSTGRSDQIEEERRLLYVAMTRAKNDLHLIAPLKYYVANQPKNGDRHVYGARSRFLTKAVMARLDTITWPDTPDEPDPPPASTTARVNVAGRLRGACGKTLLIAFSIEMSTPQKPGRVHGEETAFIRSSKAERCAGKIGHQSLRKRIQKASVLGQHSPIAPLQRAFDFTQRPGRGNLDVAPRTRASLPRDRGSICSGSIVSTASSETM